MIGKIINNRMRKHQEDEGNQQSPRTCSHFCVGGCRLIALLELFMAMKQRVSKKQLV